MSLQELHAKSREHGRHGGEPMVLCPVLERDQFRPDHPVNSNVKDPDYLVDNVSRCRLSHFEARSQREPVIERFPKAPGAPRNIEAFRGLDVPQDFEGLR